MWVHREKLVETLAKYKDFRTSLLTLLEQDGLNQNAVRYTINTYSNTFCLSDETAELRPEVTICDAHVSDKFCYAWESCDNLHICPVYVEGVCDNDCCPLGHSWSTDHNLKILQSFNMDKLTADNLRNLIQLTLSEVNPLDVCRNYNSDVCQRRECHSLHICLDFITGNANCPLPSCNLNHYTSEPSVCKLLEDHGIPSNGCAKEIVAKVLAQNLDLSKKVKDHKKDPSAISAEPEPDTDLDPEPIGLSSTVWSHFYKGDVPKPEICYLSVEGRCQLEALGCPRLHAMEHYHWQVSKDSIQWFNLQSLQVNTLERAFCDPAKERVTIPRLDITLVTTSNPLLSLMGRDLWRADFTMNTLTDSAEEKTLTLRRLCTEKTENKIEPRIFVWYYIYENNWIEYGRPNPALEDEFDCNVSSEDIEEAYNNQTTFSLMKLNYINFQSMTHVNEFLYECKVRRRPKPHLREEKDEREEGNVIQNLPSGWNVMDSEERLRVVDLPPWHEEHEQVVALLQSSLIKVKAVKVERIQNPFLWRAIQNKIEQLTASYGGSEKVNVCTLFHGTDVDVVKYICTENFDWRLHGSRFGQKFGRGAYFSTEADKALEYCMPDAKNQRYLFVARVVVGMTVEGDSSMVRPPKNPEMGVPFDSTVNDVYDPTIIVKYDKQEYYPEYIVTLA